MGLPGMCLQCASQGENDEDHCKTTFSRGQNGVLTRVLKRTMGSGGTHGQASISASGTAVHKHVRQHIRFSQENTWLKVHKNESVQSISCKPWNPCQHFRAFLSTCFGILDKNSNFMDKNFVSIPTLSIRWPFTCQNLAVHARERAETTKIKSDVLETPGHLDARFKIRALRVPCTRLLKDLFFREGYQYDFVFDWTILNYQSKHDSQDKLKLNHWKP